MDDIRTKQRVVNPDHNPEDPNSRPFVWQYEYLGRPLLAGDVVEFLCSGRGRGNHLRVLARVTKVNRKTFKAIELPGYYCPTTPWTVNIEYALEPGNGGITVALDWKDRTI